MSKILVIDDDPLVRNTIGRILRRQGHEPVMAADGRQGLDLFRREQPELIITDIIMPDIEGIETIRAICRLRPGARIIAISGGGRLGNMDFLALAGKLGACETLAKPFTPAALLERIARCLGVAAPDPGDRPGSGTGFSSDACAETAAD